MFKKTVIGRALERDALVFVRQSSKYQEHENLGSAEIQLGQREELVQIGWDQDRIEVIDARAESGESDRDRPQFGYLLDRTRSGEVGIVSVGRSDRLGRNDLDSSVFLKAAAENDVLVRSGGRIYNPSDDADRMMLEIFSAFAQYENRARKRWLLWSEFAKAKKLALRYPMPTGLVWASPSDDIYRERLHKAGLGDHLDQLDLHETAVTHEGDSYYILPFPDADLELSVRLRFQWLLETGDMNEVVDRIFDPDSGWPRPGKIPVQTRGVVRYRPDTAPTWREGSRRQQYARIREWITSPALSGTYEYHGQALEDITFEADEGDFHVRVEDAFPSFISPEEARQIDKVLSVHKKGWAQGDYDGPQVHALEMLRCGEELDDGTRCGRKMCAVHTVEREHGYYSHGCRDRGHPTSHVRAGIDDVVIREVLQAFDSELVAAAVARLRVDESNTLERKRNLQRRIREIDAQIDGLKKLELEAALRDDPRDEADWRADRKEKQREKRNAESMLAQAERDERRLRKMQDADLQRIKDLGSDLEQLIERTQEQHPKMLRRIMLQLIDRVDFRRVHSFGYELEIVFPTGRTVEVTQLTRGFRAPPAAMAWAHGRTEEGADSEDIAETLNTAPPKNHHVPWTADRVDAAHHIFRHTDQPDLRAKPDPVAASDLANRFGIDREQVLKAAFLDHLGPAVYADGNLLLTPTEEELHFGIPEAARVAVARDQGWPVDDVEALADFVSRSEHSKRIARGFANAGSGTARDATGKLYARTSELEGGLELAIRRALNDENPEYLDLDPAGWEPLADVSRRHPDIHKESLRRGDYPTVRPGAGYNGSRSVYVHEPSIST